MFYFRARCQFPIRFSKLSVQLNNSIYNDYCKVTDGHGISAVSDGDFTDKDLYLIPGKTKLYTFSFLPVKDDINSQIEVSVRILIYQVSGHQFTDRGLLMLYIETLVEMT